MSNKSFGKEHIQFYCKSSAKAIIPDFIFGILFFAILALLDCRKSGIIIVATFILIRIFFITGNRLVLTERKLILTQGIFKRKTFIPLSKIQFAQAEQSFIEKIFGYGKITVFTPNKSYCICCLKKPELICAEVMRQADIYNFKRTCHQAETAKKLMDK